MQGLDGAVLTPELCFGHLSTVPVGTYPMPGTAL